MRVALVYDRINKWGGAERLILALKKIYPNADLFTSVYNKDTATWARTFKNIKTSFLQDFPLASSSHETYAALMPIAFENFSFDNYDLVVSITSESAKGIITRPGTRHVCFCLTPTRYLWSGYEIYFRNTLLRFFSKPIISYLRYWDKIASQRPDSYLAVSQEVKERIRKYYGRESKVLYPPLSFVQEKLKIQNIKNGKYFLVVSRLVPYKRIDLAIKACNKLNLPLKIVGIGSQKRYLKLISKKNVEFLGFVSDNELSNLYKNCRALIFPGIEDFGTVMVEAQSFGKSVIAYRAGGALEIVREGKTGEFFNSQTADSLANILEKWDDKRYNSESCIRNSERFSFKNFKKEFIGFLENNL